MLPAENGRIQAGDADAGIAPAADIAPQDGEAVAHDFIGQQRETLAETFAEGRRGIGGLPARGGAQIQHLQAGLHLRQHPPQQFPDEHGGGILDIVAAGMEQRVEGEIGPLAEDAAVRTPRNGGEIGGIHSRLGQAEGIEADGDRRGLRSESRQDTRGRLRTIGLGEHIRECLRESGHATCRTAWGRILPASGLRKRPPASPRLCRAPAGAWSRASSSS